jgi:hypothetical protein
VVFGYLNLLFGQYGHMKKLGFAGVDYGVANDRVAGYILIQEPCNWPACSNAFSHSGHDAPFKTSLLIHTCPKRNHEAAPVLHVDIL